MKRGFFCSLVLFATQHPIKDHQPCAPPCKVLESALRPPEIEPSATRKACRKDLLLDNIEGEKQDSEGQWPP